MDERWLFFTKSPHFSARLFLCKLVFFCWFCDRIQFTVPVVDDEREVEDWPKRFIIDLLLIKVITVRLFKEPNDSNELTINICCRPLEFASVVDDDCDKHDNLVKSTQSSVFLFIRDAVSVWIKIGGGDETICKRRLWTFSFEVCKWLLIVLDERLISAGDRRGGESGGRDVDIEIETGDNGIGEKKYEWSAVKLFSWCSNSLATKLFCTGE